MFNGLGNLHRILMEYVLERGPVEFRALAMWSIASSARPSE